ncbi:carbohydrate kinase family protein [Tissierella sp. Yu-01]|uniref:carbohydrate kinase family protein n=1 Tax=Tissierella sp. Yu-01 TaxID=3035694 RepID=UPI00240E6E2B|nr:carbohydrate kinase family protein [Tissierella sp. Yu-01]WFA09972.1 carbohydrate kinase family protein [Tissierella sp. Yu-01]
MNNYVCVIGGANIDIIGTPYSRLNEHDSNPGRLSTTLGGVGRNIAENLSKMGVQVEFISVFGNDNYAREIEENCNELNIGLEHSEIIEKENTSTYLCINNEKGEMQLAISDMGIYEYMTPFFLSSRLHIINNAQACVIDTNIPSVSLDYLMDNVRVPIFVDTVSKKKTEKIKDFIHNIYAIKPNIYEAEILSGMSIKSEDDYKLATEIILDKGVKEIYMSLGSEGVYYTDGKSFGKLPVISDKIVNTTGAGDSFLAGVVWAYLNEMDILSCTKAGLAASYITINSPKTVSENISEEKIKQIIEDNWRN